MLKDFANNASPSSDQKHTVELYRARTWQRFSSNERTAILNVNIMDHLDRIFEESFNPTDAGLDPKLLLGTRHPTYLLHFNEYRNRIKTYFVTKIIDSNDANLQEISEQTVWQNMEVKLEWLFTQDHPDRPPMPLFCKSLIIAIASNFKESAEAFKEASSHYSLLVIIIC